VLQVIESDVLPPRENAICLAAALAITYYSTISANLMATHDVEKMLFFRPKIANTLENACAKSTMYHSTEIHLAVITKSMLWR